MRILSVFGVLFLIVPMVFAGDPELERATPLFGDLDFRRGFKLSYPNSTQGHRVAAVLRSDSEGEKEPLWRLCQWGTKHSLANATPISSAEGITFENSAKRVVIARSGSAPDSGGLVLDIRGGVEYGDRARRRGEAWPHLLVEQDALRHHPLSGLARLELEIDLRLLSFVGRMTEAPDPGLHAAQFQLFFIVKNIAKGSSDHRDFFWFGVPFFDSRRDFPAAHRARDAGKDSATGKFIYTIPGKEILSVPMKEKRWVQVRKDLLPFILAGLRDAVSRGYLDSDDAREYAVVNMNLGWEIPGSFDAAIRVRNLAISATPRKDPWRALQTVPREAPRAGTHPGNVHLSGEEVRIRLPPEIAASGKARRWRLLDDRDRAIRSGEFANELPASVSVGKPGIGWYRLEVLDDDDNQVGWTTAAVLAPLRAPVPQDSPVCVDGAVSWFARNDPARQARFARLAALAGVNWIRDRLRWSDVQPAPGELVESENYVNSASADTREGLKVLQVFHDTPRWAAEDDASRGRFPPDLRVVYRFSKALAQRFQGRVLAWEPWNEANIGHFGGHTIDAICSFQKAAYLGFKSADPDVTVCWNAHAGIHTRLHARGVLENETWPYFETYNIHSYDWPHSYFDLWEFARDAASGRPLWVTESDRGSYYVTGEPWFDLSRRDERLKAEFLAQSYAQSLFAGSQRHFHFVLGHYYETRNRVQFGLLRRDLTPRPAYVALAAAGRFLAGAKCLGKLRTPRESLATVIVFRAEPDGVSRDVLVAWAEKTVDWPARGKVVVDGPLPADLRVEAAFDYLGRKLESAAPAKLSSAPLFVVLREGEREKLSLESVPSSSWRGGEPSSVVLQLRMPRSTIEDIAQRKWAQEFHYVVKGGEAVKPSIFAYNLGTRAVRGIVEVQHVPKGWKVEPMMWDLSLAPMERARLEVRVDRPAVAGGSRADTQIKWRGDFGAAGQPALSFRLLADPAEGYER